MASPRRVRVAVTIGRTLHKGLLHLDSLRHVDAVRLNFSHIQHDQALPLVELLRKYAPDLIIWQDLQGPKLRVGDLGEAEFRVLRGDPIVFASEAAVPRLAQSARRRLVPISMPGPFSAWLGVSSFSMKDGSCRLEVTENRADSHGFFVATPETDLVLRTGKSINAPLNRDGVFDGMTEKDKKDLAWGVANGIDVISLSYVEDDTAIHQCREMIAGVRGGGTPRVWAKIETSDGCRNFKRILMAADGVVVARGDLVPEIGSSQCSVMQYKLLREFRSSRDSSRKECIVATHVLQSMMHAEEPSIAELNDITNSLDAGATGFLLGIEVSSGQYPDECIQVMNRHLSFLDTHSPQGGGALREKTRVPRRGAPAATRRGKNS